MEEKKHNKTANNVFLGADALYAYPATDISFYQNRVFNAFLSGVKKGKKLNFYSDLASLILAQTECSEGVTINLITEDATNEFNEPSSYNSTTNTITINEKAIDSSISKAFAIQVFAREIFRKKQFEVNKNAKLFSESENYYAVPEVKLVPKILGAKYKGAYSLNASAQQAHEYEAYYMASFFDLLRTFASENAEPSTKDFIDEQEIYSKSINRVQLQKCKSAQTEFTSQTLPNFYDYTTETLNELNKYLLDSKVLGNLRAKAINDDIYKKLKKAGANTFNKPRVAIEAMTEILSTCPNREHIERFIDSVTYRSINAQTDKAILALASNRVPITQSDYTRLMLSYSGYGVDIDTYADKHKALQLVDEKVSAKNLVANWGVAGAKKYLQKIQNRLSLYDNKSNDPLIGRIDTLISSYSKKPFLTLEGGTPMFSCKDILTSVCSRETERAVKQETNSDRSEIFNKKFVTYSKTMANIVDNFDTLSADNPDLIKALKKFEKNPSIKQFPDKQQPTEIGQYYPSSVSKKIAEHIEEVRATQQTKEVQNNNTTPNPVITYETLLPKSKNEVTLGNALAKQFSPLTTTVKQGVRGVIKNAKRNIKNLLQGISANINIAQPQSANIKQTTQITKACGVLYTKQNAPKIKSITKQKATSAKVSGVAQRALQKQKHLQSETSVLTTQNTHYNKGTPYSNPVSPIANTTTETQLPYKSVLSEQEIKLEMFKRNYFENRIQYVSSSIQENTSATQYTNFTSEMEYTNSSNSLDTATNETEFTNNSVISESEMGMELFKRDFFESRIQYVSTSVQESSNITLEPELTQ